MPRHRVRRSPRRFWALSQVGAAGADDSTHLTCAPPPSLHGRPRHAQTRRRWYCSDLSSTGRISRTKISFFHATFAGAPAYKLAPNTSPPNFVSHNTKPTQPCNAVHCVRYLRGRCFPRVWEGEERATICADVRNVSWWAWTQSWNSKRQHLGTALAAAAALHSHCARHAQTKPRKPSLDKRKRDSPTRPCVRCALPR